MIFSNTTPFIALSVINRLELLPAVFERIHVVPHVVAECQSGGVIAVPNLRTLPWVVVVNVDESVDPNPLLTPLDIGEKWTLYAAAEAHASRVLIDERIARNVAERMGLTVTGTLGVLLKAKQLGLIRSFNESAAEMRAAGIFYNTDLIRRLAISIGE